MQLVKIHVKSSLISEICLFCSMEVIAPLCTDIIIKFVGNTRVVNQKELEFFREELQNRMSSSYNVILKDRKLPLSLLNDHQKVLWCFLLRC